MNQYSYFKTIESGWIVTEGIQGLQLIIACASSKHTALRIIKALELLDKEGSSDQN